MRRFGTILAILMRPLETKVPSEEAKNSLKAGSDQKLFYEIKFQCMAYPGTVN